MATSGREKHNAQRYTDIVVNVVTPVLVTVLEWATPNKLPNVHFDQYMIDLGVPGKKRKYVDIQKGKIRKSPGCKTFDITLLTKCLLLVCKFDPMWADPANTLEDHILSLKNIRNTVSHGNLSLTDLEFDEKVKELKTILIRLLNAATQRFKRSESERDNKNVEIHNGIHKITNEILGIEDIQENRGNQIKDDLLNAGKKELKRNLENCRTFDPLASIRATGLKLDVEKNFTNVTFKTSDSDAKEKKVDYSKLLSIIDPGVGALGYGLAQGLGAVRPGSLGNNNNNNNIDPGVSEPQILMVEGQAGSGKTMLLKHIAQEWLDGSHGNQTLQGLDQYELVLRVCCQSTNITSFTNLIQEAMPKFYLKYQDLTLLIIKKCRLLMLVDGLDEQNSQSQKLVQSLLDELRNNPRCVMLCTSRPESVQGFKRIAWGYVAKDVELLGIDKADRLDFLLRYFQECRPNESTHDLVKICGKVCDREHYRFPINLVLLVWQYLDDPNSISEGNTPTDLYHWVHQLHLQKLMGRLNDLTLDESDLEKLVYEVLGRIMLQGLAQDQLVLNTQAVEQVKSECKARNVPRYKEVLSAFLTTTRTKASLRDVETYTAPHKGMQEYLAALYVVGKFRTHDGPCSIQHVLQMAVPCELRLDKLQNVIQHVAGVLYQQLAPDDPRLDEAVPEVVKLLHQAGVKKQDEWLSVIEDTKLAPAMLKNIAHYFPSGERLKICDGRLVSYCQLLPHLEQRTVEVHIDGDPSVLNTSSELLCHKIQELHLCQDFHHPHMATADQDPILHTMLSRGGLEQFMGLLTEGVASALPSTVQFLSVAVITDTQASRLSALDRLANLRWLHVHVGKDVTPAVLTRPLHAMKGVELYFSDLGATTTTTIDQDIIRVGEIARLLSPKRGYKIIHFPRCGVDMAGVRRLVEVLKDNGVKVYGGVNIPNDTITQDEREELNSLTRNKLSCKFWRLSYLNKFDGP